MCKRIIISCHKAAVAHSAEMSELREISKKYNVPLVEDAAQAIGAEFEGKRAGAMSEIGCFSFYPSKNLGTIGEGGMAVTNDAVLAARMRSLRSHGEVTRYYHSEPGWNPLDPPSV